MAQRIPYAQWILDSYSRITLLLPGYRCPHSVPKWTKATILTHITVFVLHDRTHYENSLLLRSHRIDGKVYSAWVKDPHRINRKSVLEV